MSIPSGYRRVEYLESVFTSATDHPYIVVLSLGTTPFKKGEYKMKIRRYDNGEMRLMGFGNNQLTTDYGNSCWNVVGGNSNPHDIAFNYGGSWKDVIDTEHSYVGIDLEVDYKFEDGSLTFKLNDRTEPWNNAFSYSGGCTGFYLFRVNNNMLSRMTGSARIYYAQIYNDGVLVADLVPVAKGTVGYMYDSVSNSILGAVPGSGQFVCGEDVLCKFKDSANLKLCKAIHGYCQFQENGYQDGHSCPIKENFKDLVI